VKRSIPVLYYHRVGAPDPTFLSMPTAAFEAQMGFLARHGIRTLDMTAFLGHISGRRPIRGPAVLVTFDDGFRDNLLHAAPILRRHGQHAVIFVATGLIRPDTASPAPEPRPFTRACLAARQGDCGDFLSGSEMEALFTAGIYEFHAHGHSHAQVFKDPVITGFYPETDTHWGIPTAYRDSLSSGVWPVFSRGPGLVHRALVADTSALECFMASLPPAQYADRTAWPALAGRMAGFLHRETEEEWRRRVTDDLRLSKERTDAWHLPGTATICWPWGADSPALREIARHLGFQAGFLTATGSNHPGIDPFQVTRFPVKKASLARFALGLLLRSASPIARLYGALHGRM